MPVRLPCRTTLAEIRPLLAYRIRFDPSSETAIAIHSVVVAPNPCSVASRRAIRLARSTSAWLSTGTMVGKSTSAPPFPDGDGRATSRRGVDREVVHQPPRPRKAHPESRPGGEPVPERLIDVRDPRPLVAHHDFESGSSRLVGDLAHDRLAAPVGGIPHDVSRELGDGRGDSALIDHAEPEPAGRLARGLPCKDNAVLTGDG